jgi:RecB family exonuclease
MAWKQRAATMLTDLYERWPSDGVPVSLETNLPLELGGVSWLGRADRIERDGEALTVVDYKTGSAASLADAAVSLQLGYYLLAARDSKDLANEGQVNAAVFWHPKQIAYGKVTTRSFDMANLDAVRDDLVAIADAIGNEQFDPTPGSHCRTCPASAICPAQAIGVEAFIA